jgi:hypothetical protein
MANDFSVSCYVGSAEQVKPVINCAQDVKECWDGTYLSRDPSNDCQFPPCPPEPRWFTRADMINNGVTTTAWLQCHGTKTVAQPQYNQLSAMQVESGGSVYLRVKNYTNCNNVVIDPLNQGLVAEKYIGTANPYKLYRDYFNLRDRWRRLTRTFVNQWSVYPNLSSCPGYVSDPIPTPTPTPTDQPVVNPPVAPDPTPTPTPTDQSVVVGETYRYNLTPIGSSHYDVQPDIHMTLVSYAGYDASIGTQGEIKYNDTVELINTAHPSHPLALQVLNGDGDIAHSVSSDNSGKVSINLRELENTVPDLAAAMNNGSQILVKYYCVSHPNTMVGALYINA